MIVNQPAQYRWVPQTQYNSKCTGPTDKNGGICGELIPAGTEGPFALRVAEIDKEGRRVGGNRLFCKKCTARLVKTGRLEPFQARAARIAKEFGL